MRFFCRRRQHPLGLIKPAIEALKALYLPAADRRKIFVGNAERLLGKKILAGRRESRPIAVLQMIADRLREKSEQRSKGAGTGRR